MDNNINIISLVEGKTEQIFIDKILAPYLAVKNIFISATQFSKPGQKGGDVRFPRVVRDIGKHLKQMKQRSNVYVTTFFDYYGVKEWPGLDKTNNRMRPQEIAEMINNATKEEVLKKFKDCRAEERFIPYVAVHEFEALLFSDPEVLANKLNIDQLEIDEVLTQFLDNPEAINNNRQTAPSKRLNNWSENKKFLKTTTGIAIAEEIGIDVIRTKCHLFNSWLLTFEGIIT